MPCMQEHARTKRAGRGFTLRRPIDTDIAKDLDMDKFSPAQVAQRTIQAIESGQENAFTDAFSEETYAAIRKDPKEVERTNRENFIEQAKTA